VDAQALPLRGIDASIVVNGALAILASPLATNCMDNPSFS
jgi:hypothetical protein